MSRQDQYAAHNAIAAICAERDTFRAERDALAAERDALLARAVAAEARAEELQRRLDDNEALLGCPVHAERDEWRAKVAAVEALRELSDAATPGPWEFDPGVHGDPLIAQADRGPFGAVATAYDDETHAQLGMIAMGSRTPPEGRDDYGRANALFIAAACNYVRAALAAASPGDEEEPLVERAREAYQQSKQRPDARSVPRADLATGAFLGEPEETK